MSRDFNVLIERDDLGVFKVQGQDLDQQYLWHWAEVLDVRALLGWAVEESSHH